jgi:hydroxyacylglutathione hydrolase
MSNTQPNVLSILSRPFGENSYIAWFQGRSDCVVFDPGFEPDKIIEALRQNNLTPVAQLITHGHSDHIAGIRTLKEEWPECPIVIGEREADKLLDPKKNLSARFGTPITSPPADRLVAEGDQIQYAGFDFEIREIPGHSSGHVVYIWSAGKPQLVFGGDVLFAGSVGRTDFPDGSFEVLAKGIREKLFVLPDETIVLSGHGPPTTVGEEKRSNPFVGERPVA